jgi:hypothetical protein
MTMKAAEVRQVALLPSGPARILRVRGQITRDIAAGWGCDSM